MNLLFLYYDLMNLYGETGNMRVLERHLRDQGLDITVVGKTLGDELDFSQYDFVYAGSGTEKSQKVAMRHLLQYRDSFAQAVERGVPMLFTGNAFEMLGASVCDGNGTLHQGLGILPFTTTEQGQTRYVADALASCELVEPEVVGFVNKCSQCEGITSPLFRLSMGYGNMPNGKEEGLHYRNILGTHFIGPVLVKNPALMEWVVNRIGERQEGFTYTPKRYEYEEKAYLASYMGLKEYLQSQQAK